MTPDDYEVLLTQAYDETAFSNGTERDDWMAVNCDRCVHDASARSGLGVGCPLVTIAILDERRPLQFVEGPRDAEGRCSMARKWTCTEFTETALGGGAA